MTLAKPNNAIPTTFIFLIFSRKGPLKTWSFKKKIFWFGSIEVKILQISATALFLPHNNNIWKIYFIFIKFSSKLYFQMKDTTQAKSIWSYSKRVWKCVKHSSGWSPGFDGQVSQMYLVFMDLWFSPFFALA